MTDSTVVAGAETARPGLLSRFVGVLFSPREIFAVVTKDPRWLGTFVLVLGISAVAVSAFFSTAVGQQAWLDQAVRQTESFGGSVSDQQYQGMERIAPYMGYLAVGYVAVVAPIVMLVLSGMLFAVFNAALGGDASFKQVFAIVVHAGVVTTIQQLFVMPLNYARESMTGATNVAVLLPMLPEGTFVTRFLGVIDLFLVWWVIVLATGMAVLYRRETAPIAASFLAVYGIIGLIIAAVLSGRGGS